MLQKNKFTRVVHFENLDSNFEHNKELKCLDNEINYGEGNSLETEISNFGFHSFTLIYNSNYEINNEFCTKKAAPINIIFFGVFD